MTDFLNGLQRHGVEVGYLRVNLYEFVNETSVIPWSSTANGDFPNGQSRYRFPLDLRRYDEMRFTFYVNSAAGNGNLSIQYATTLTGSAAHIGGTSPTLSTNTTGAKDTGWVDMVAGAQADDLYLLVRQATNVNTPGREIVRMSAEFRSKIP